MINQIPFVSVIIPVYNDSDRLKSCLESLRAQSYPSDRYEIIVVDNGSDENIADIVSEFDIATLEFEKVKGSYAARNKGISLAKGEILAFTDSDCKPTRNWIKEGVKALISIDNCGLVAGEIDLFYRQPDSLSPAEIYEYIVAFQQQKNIEMLHFGATANVFTFKSVFQNVGLFNSTMKSGGDREWGNRVYSAGYLQIYAAHARVYHPARHTIEQLLRKSTRITLGVKEKNIKTIAKTYVRMLFVPPIDLIQKGLNSDGLSILQKLQFLFVVFIVRYSAVWQTTRLLFGAQPKR